MTTDYISHKSFHFLSLSLFYFDKLLKDYYDPVVLKTWIIILEVFYM